MDENEVTEALVEIENRLDDMLEAYGPELMSYLMQEMAGFYSWIESEEYLDEYVEEEFEKIVRHTKLSVDDE